MVGVGRAVVWRARGGCVVGPGGCVVGLKGGGGCVVGPGSCLVGPGSCVLGLEGHLCALRLLLEDI